MSAELVERVARAMKPLLWEGNKPDDQVGPATRYERNFVRDMARRGLEASGLLAERERLNSALSKCQEHNRKLMFGRLHRSHKRRAAQPPSAKEGQ